MIAYLVIRLVMLTALAFRWALLLPFAAARAAFHGTRRVTGATTLVTRDNLICASCSQPISLVNRYRCGRCGYIFDGFAFARCAVCGAVPPYVPCSTCGAGLRNPIHRIEPHR
jgi:ribosomal protein S27AE